MTNKEVYSLFGLFRFFSLREKCLFFVAILTSGGFGVVRPILSIILGNILNSIGGLSRSVLNDLIIKLIIVAAVTFVCAWISQTILIYVSKKAVNRLKVAVLKAVLNQDQEYFDLNKLTELPTKIEEDVRKISDALGPKLNQFILNIIMFVAGFIIGFYKGWLLACVMMACLPLMIIAGFIFGTSMKKRTSAERIAYGKAGAIAEEIVNGIRTVAAFGREEHEISRYSAELEIARKSSTKGGAVFGVSVGLMIASFMWTYALSLWYGGRLVEQGKINPTTGQPYNGGDILTVLFSIIMATFATSQIAPFYQTLSEAKVAFSALNSIIQNVPKIEPKENDKSEKITNLEMQEISFEDVSFRYPSRPEVLALNKISFKILRGQKVAFVGESGSGKSTTVSLLMRFYDPESGKISINGIDVKNLDVRKCLRRMIGYVGQEPVLFATTLKQNILAGADPTTTDEDIQNAIKKANAQNVINKCPKGLETYAGGGSGLSQLSGGEKQRIAIVRALLRKPQILLLDEATSALDNESEKKIQKTLDNLVSSETITTISVAHRLSTIRNCDVIFAIERGVLKEQGTHEELIAQKGYYHALVSAQESVSKKENRTRSLSIDAEKAEEVSNVKVKTDEEILDQEELEKLEKKKMKDLIKNYKAPIRRIFTTFGWPERFVIIPGFLAAMAHGGLMPVFSWVLSRALGAFSTPGFAGLSEKVRETGIAFLTLGFCALFAIFLQTYVFTYTGEFLKVRVRRACLTKIMFNSASFFDNPENAPGKLTYVLGDYANKMSPISGNNLAIYIQALGSLIVGVIIALYFAWKVALVMMAIIPLIALGGAVQIPKEKEDKDGKSSSASATECIINIKTVKAGSIEDFQVENYTNLLKRASAKSSFEAFKTGILFGVGNMGIFIAYAVGYYYGGNLVIDGKLTFGNMLTGMFGILMGSMGLGQAFIFIGDLGEAKSACFNVFKLLDSPTDIDVRETKDKKATELSKEGDLVIFENVQFRYPQRPETLILKGLTFQMKANTKNALVGPSGGGKSTVMALIQRFYDCNGGTVSIGGLDIKEWDLAHLRSFIGVVTQEPILFDITLRENLCYGVTGRVVSNEELEEVARQAKLNDFVGVSIQWNDRVGPRGCQLSGGQKQRVAIARALLRKPQILLLDEATSALDSTSEAIVQEALDNASVGRTTITIAHRLSTIENSDTIFVIANGILIEKGNHRELMEAKGVYRDLYMKGQK